MSGHTHGPWVAEPEEASDGRGIAICAPNSDRILATITQEEDWPVDEKDWANARLMAAAPDLLAALEQIARFNKDGETVDGIVFEMPIDDAFETINSVIGLARAAIKKVQSKEVIDIDPA